MVGNFLLFFINSPINSFLVTFLTLLTLKTSQLLMHGTALHIASCTSLKAIIFVRCLNLNAN
jgi:hypothetical protein